MLFDSVLRTQMQFGIVVFFFILCSADRRLAHLPPQGFNTLVVCAIVVTMSSRRAFVVSSHVSGGTRYSSRYQRHQSIKSLKVFAFFLGSKRRDERQWGVGEIGSVSTERKEEEEMESCGDPSYRREKVNRSWRVTTHYREFRQKYDCTFVPRAEETSLEPRHDQSLLCFF